MGLFHVAYNGYVWKALFLYRHPERSGGIFLAYWYSVLCAIAGKRNSSAKGARKSGVRGIFLDFARNDVRGEWITHVPYKGYVGKMPLPQRHPERSGGIFLAYWYSVLCETAEKGKPFAKGARKSRVQGRFLAALEMTVGENGFISCSVQRICWENATSVTSSRAEPRDLSCRRG